MTSPAPATSSAAYRQALAALHKQQRAQLQLLIQQIDASLAADWQRGPGAAAEFFQPLLDAYAKALADLRALNDDPAATLDLSWLTSHNAQLQSIEASVRASMINYGQQAAKTVEDAQVAMLARGESDAEALVQEALNPAWELGVNPAMLWDRPNPDAIAQWLGRAGNGHPLGDLFANFDREAAAAARQAILSGLATGANPMSILTALQQALGISRSRALTISRTELLGSYRAAAHETYRANSDVLNGWLWSAGGNNPCAMCMGMDGTLHGLEESLDDHPCGKCAPLPVTKPWDDILGPLGIDTSDMVETSLGAEGNYEPMSERFDDFSPERQRAIIGTQTGYEAWQRGEVTLKDFIGVRPGENGFPSSYYQRSLKEMQIPTRQSQRLVEPSQEILEKYRLGTLRYSDFGQITPDALMPAWAKDSDASRIVYQILRNGLPYDMSSHEQGLLITNLEQMLRGELPTNVRAAAERQLQALGQTVERSTVGQAAKDLVAREASGISKEAQTEATRLESEAQAIMRQANRAVRAEARDFLGYEGTPAEDLFHQAAELLAQADQLRGGIGAVIDRSVYATIDEAGKLERSDPLDAVREIFGKDVSRDDIARLVGAQQGDAVTIEFGTWGKNSFSYTVESADGRFASGQFFLDDGKPVLEDVLVQNPMGARDAGSGADILESLDFMRQMGVTRLDAEAAGSFDTIKDGYRGYYTWARLGFTGDIPESVLNDAQMRFGEDVRTVQDLMALPGGPAWWKIHGQSWEASFDFTDGSYSRSVLDDLLRRLRSRQS